MQRYCKYYLCYLMLLVRQSPTTQHTVFIIQSCSPAFCWELVTANAALATARTPPTAVGWLRTWGGTPTEAKKRRNTGKGEELLLVRRPTMAEAVAYSNNLKSFGSIFLRASSSSVILLKYSIIATTCSSSSIINCPTV